MDATLILAFILLILVDLIVILHLVDVSSQCKIYQVYHVELLSINLSIVTVSVEFY